MSSRPAPAETQPQSVDTISARELATEESALKAALKESTASAELERLSHEEQMRRAMELSLQGGSTASRRPSFPAHNVSPSECCCFSLPWAYRTIPDG